MHNRIGFNRLGRKPSHRKSLHRNMVTSLIKHERIETTQAKAKEIRRTAEKLVTRAKVDSVHNRRIVAKTVYEKEAVNKLFTEVGPRFADRPGGYTRILKLGRRKGDAAEMVILEFLGDDEQYSAKKKAPAKKKTAPKPAKKAEAPVADSAVDEAKAEEPAVEESAVDEAKAESKDEKVEAKKAETEEVAAEAAPEAEAENKEGESE